VARVAVPRHRDVRLGARALILDRRQPGRRDRLPEVHRLPPGGLCRRDLQGGGDLLPPLLLQPPLHLEVGEEDGARSRGGEAAPRRGQGVPGLHVETAPDRADAVPPPGGGRAGVMSALAWLVLAVSAFATAHQLFGLLASAAFFRRARRRAARARDY